MKFPLAVAPSGMQCMAHEDGESATARAATKAGVFMGVSTFATTSLEDIKAAGDDIGNNVYMLQLYVFKNRKTTEDLVKRAEATGYKALLLTCDTPKLGNRYCMTRNDFKMPSHLNLPNFGQQSVRPLLVEMSREDVEKQPDPNVNDDSITWEETLLWLRSITKLEIWLKGVTTAEDVALAIKSPANISGIIVSNHGGRQLESALSTLDSLPECVEAAKAADRHIQVWLDGGIRKGSDIFKALALGADGVMIGRVPLWGLTVGGEAGVSKALNILKSEFQHTMALAGCRDLKDITLSSLSKRVEGGFYARL
ncbi:(S)-2-hydroxy-acid oxidase [Colletotrichum karsti]|uniref:(S)-2-hydroxy-acid oxidase n=1 Tax=Colletotrichum karsti TaxID=1095194 RepID=A0A9P6IIV2_9PEZI|nr:(S)-2-hydroxy-acid oxidase [Colletotrichum karsti]KAF9880495.1 (S)-2-hydroxy-acid oxidase [Colletotrichum karsti]